MDPVGAARLAGLLRRERIEVVHAHKGGGRTLTLLARGLGPRPPLVVNRGVSFPMAPVSRWVDGSRVVARHRRRVPGDQGRSRPPGAPGGEDRGRLLRDRHRPVRPRPRERRPGSAGSSASTADTPLVTQIGVREPKGNDDLLRAFARVRAARPDARLLLVGARPEKRAPLEALARAGGLGDAVTIWGYRDDVPEVLAASQVSVDASHEGLGITGTLRESLAMETPVVATRAMGNPELVGHEEHGLLVPPRDPEAMAAAILRLLADPAWARSLGQAGRVRVVAGFSTRAKVERLERLYARVARARSRPTG